MQTESREPVLDASVQQVVARWHCTADGRLEAQWLPATPAAALRTLDSQQVHQDHTHSVPRIVAQVRGPPRSDHSRHQRNSTRSIGRQPIAAALLLRPTLPPPTISCSRT